MFDVHDCVGFISAHGGTRNSYEYACRVRPITTKLDSSRLRAMSVRRKLAESRANNKLAVIRNLRGHATTGTLAKFSEENVEQSFNEQFFGTVLGYRTMLSSEGSFNVLPQNYLGNNRYDDCSLGFFGIAQPRTLVSAEHKRARIDLDKRRSTRQGKQSAVEQAFSAARNLPDCRWIIVSNFIELRLYSIACDSEPLAKIQLIDITTPAQLAALCALLDPDALL